MRSIQASSPFGTRADSPVGEGFVEAMGETGEEGIERLSNLFSVSRV
jgi:hypothetical protein